MSKVQIVVLAPDGRVVEKRVYDDCWYASGGGRPPEQQQRAREEAAAGELRDWLRLWDPVPGRYTISVSEVPDHGGSGRVWASVHMVHTKRHSRR